MAEDQSLEQSLDDALASLGIDNSPITREDELYLHLTEGKHPRISNIRYLLISEMGRFKDMKEQGFKITKDKLYNNVVQAVMLTKTEYAIVAIAYFLQVYHAPYFMDLSGKPAADLAKMANKLAEYPDIKEIIEKYG